MSRLHLEHLQCHAAAATPAAAAPRPASLCVEAGPYTHQTAVIRMALPTTERPVWHCGERTAKLESAACRRFPYCQNLLFSAARGREHALHGAFTAALTCTAVGWSEISLHPVTRRLLPAAPQPGERAVSTHPLANRPIDLRSGTRKGDDVTVRLARAYIRP